MQKIIEERTAEIRGHGFFDFERSAYGTLELELEGVYAEHVEVVIGEMAENNMIVHHPGWTTFIQERLKLSNGRHLYRFNIPPHLPAYDGFPHPPLPAACPSEIAPFRYAEINPLIVPVAGFFFVRQYRDQECGGTIGFMQAFTFTLFMYMFAALFTAVAHYIYFRYLDNGLIVGTYSDMLAQMELIATESMKPSIEQFQQALDVISALSPLDITLHLISQNIFYCTLLALPTALLVKRNTPKN